jgi:hypothetical protein
MRLVTKLRTGWRVVQQDGLGAGWALFAQTSPALQTIGRASRVMPFGLLRVGVCLFRADAEAKRFLIAGTTRAPNVWPRDASFAATSQ